MKGPGNNSFDQFTIEGRAYNNGIAFRYRIPKTVKGTLNPAAELTEYCFAADYTAWFYKEEFPNIGPEKLSKNQWKKISSHDR